MTLRDYRIAAHHTRATLAVAAGVSPETIGRLERAGRRANLDLSTAIRIARVLRLGISDLWDDLGEPTPSPDLVSRLVCAWCHVEMRAGTEPTSHGLCETCAERVREEE